MKKILQIVDVPDWAIGSLSKAIITYNPRFEWKQIAVHPKDLEQGNVDLAPIREAIVWADVIDAQYWRTLSQLLEQVPELRQKKIVLTHHNEKNLLSYDWKDVTMHIGKTEKSMKILSEKYPGKVTYIPNSFDHKFFAYNEEYPPKEKFIGYVGRVVPWKGLKEIARAAFELGYRIKFMGKMDKPSYFEEIPLEHRENIDFEFFDCEDSQRVDYYRSLSCYVGNSNDGREVGTLGFIEAMACGVPVVTTPAGLAADIIKDGENAVLVPFENYEALKAGIKKVMEDAEFAKKIREAGWQTIKNYNDEIMALRYSRMFNKVMGGDKELVSVIIPATNDRREQVERILQALSNSSYKHIEALVIWDEISPSGQMRLDRDLLDYPLTELCTGAEGYNLAMARNLGTIWAQGHYLMFCDSRMCPEPEAINEFVSKIGQHPENPVWVFGEKGGNKKTFVENFSMIRRRDLIEAGMFNERVNAYGGMSQELRGRFSAQGFNFIYCPSALAKPLVKSGLSGRRADVINMKNLLHKLDL